MFSLVDDVYVEDRLFTLKARCEYEKCKGACCKGEGLGTPLFEEDIKRIEKETGEYDFFDYQRGPRLKLRKNGECMFLRGDNCTINEIKPFFCLAFPVVLHIKDGFKYLMFQPYSECSFVKSDIHYVQSISRALVQRFGQRWYDRLLERLK
ncbi:MAG: hypothetical protein C0601_09885 [Candidatus Muiribacterium halophilum]|uniref:YkgJ family cysteine cluster protein n=1 Tax=Muiribacterium halophilum TaxID=2053465 RepID=A0A2N5ZD45_MUIH1|nr:MAG: hypothetical protein C0601_09885 [Candidatus Muirbacterium halophilum]